MADELEKPIELSKELSVLERFKLIKQKMLGKKSFDYDDAEAKLISLVVSLDKDPTLNLHNLNAKLSECNDNREEVFKLYCKILPYLTNLETVVDAIETRLDYETKLIMLTDPESRAEKNKDMKEAVARVKLNDWHELLQVFKVEAARAKNAANKINERAKIIESTRSALSRQLTQTQIIGEVEGLGTKKIRINHGGNREDSNG